MCASGVASGRQALDRIHVHGAGLEDLGLAEEHGVIAALVCERDASPESELAPARIAHHAAAGGRDADLQAPAAAETRHTGREHRLGEIDLAFHRGFARIDIQRRAGDHRAVITLERHTFGQLRLLVGGTHDVALDVRLEPLERRDITLARRRATDRHVFGARRLLVAVDDEDARHHR